MLTFLIFECIIISLEITCFVGKSLDVFINKYAFT